jgi:hypothetical protein
VAGRGGVPLESLQRGVFVPNPIGGVFKRVIRVRGQSRAEVEGARMPVHKEDGGDEEVTGGYTRVKEVERSAVSVTLIPLGWEQRWQPVADLRTGRRFEIEDEAGPVRNPALVMPENGASVRFESRGNWQAVGHACIQFVAEAPSFPTGWQEGVLGCV